MTEHEYGVLNRIPEIFNYIIDVICKEIKESNDELFFNFNLFSHSVFYVNSAWVYSTSNVKHDDDYIRIYPDSISSEPILEIKNNYHSKIASYARTDGYISINNTDINKFSVLADNGDNDERVIVHDNIFNLSDEQLFFFLLEHNVHPDIDCLKKIVHDKDFWDRFDCSTPIKIGFNIKQFNDLIQFLENVINEMESTKIDSKNRRKWRY